ncbi:MAG: DUF1549 domain-containing protein [Gemmataceae bacterium]
MVASYADNTTRDVTKEAFIETGNAEVATASPRGGMLTAVRGEHQSSPGTKAATLQRRSPSWGIAPDSMEEPPAYNRVDELTAAKWKRMQIQPSGLCTDEVHSPRVHRPHGVAANGRRRASVLADTRDQELSVTKLVDKLVGGKEYVEYWTNKWADLLQVNRKFLGVEGATSFRKWIRQEVDANTPYDEFARKVLTAKGSNKDNPAASYFKILRTPQDAMETRHTCSWPCDSTATSAMTTPSSGGLRTSTTSWPRSSHARG